MNPSAYRSLPRTVWLLGIVSLFNDLSSSLIYGLLPVFLVVEFGAAVMTVALIDGVAEMTASLGKIFSGALSDWIGKRKGLTVAGYGFSAAAKVLFPLAVSPAGVFAAKFFDRLGKGIRAAPRDAMVADVTPPELRGAAYGLRQSLDEAGTLLGPIGATVLMLLFANDMRLVFWIACVPAVISVAILMAGVREAPHPNAGRRVRFPLRTAELRRLDRAFWLFCGALLILLLPRFSSVFVLLRGQALGLSEAHVPLLLAAMSAMTTFVTAPAGHLSDRIGRRPLMIGGFALLIASHLLLALSDGPALVFAGAVLFGLHFATTEAVLAALVADMAPADLRGTAFGVFHLVSGIAILIGSVAAGWLWDEAGAPAMFVAAASVSAIGLVLLMGMSRRKKASSGE